MNVYSHYHIAYIFFYNQRILKKITFLFICKAFSNWIPRQVPFTCQIMDMMPKGYMKCTSFYIPDSFMMMHVHSVKIILFSCDFVRGNEDSHFCIHIIHLFVYVVMRCRMTVYWTHFISVAYTNVINTHSLLVVYYILFLLFFFPLNPRPISNPIEWILKKFCSSHIHAYMCFWMVMYWDENIWKKINQVYNSWYRRSFDVGSCHACNFCLCLYIKWGAVKKSADI